MTYGRLLLPKLLSNYSRAIYLDVDIVVREDLGNLFAVDLKGNLVGAVKDYGVERCPVPSLWHERKPFCSREVFGFAASVDFGSGG